MQSFKEYISENTLMEPEEIKVNAEHAVSLLKQQLEIMFRGQKVVVYLSTNLGMHIVVGVYSIPQNASHMDMLNAPSNAQFIMHMTNRFGGDVSMAKFSFEKNTIIGFALPDDPNKGFQRTKHVKVAFRKITAKSPVEASKKLLNWFKKNKKEFAQ